MVDSSESIGAQNFLLSKKFIVAVLDRLVSEQQINVSDLAGEMTLAVWGLGSPCGDAHSFYLSPPHPPGDQASQLLSSDPSVRWQGVRCGCGAVQWRQGPGEVDSWPIRHHYPLGI